MAIYLLHGDAKSTDSYEIRSRLDQLLKGVERKGNLNFHTFDLTDSGTKFGDVIASALTLPFLYGRRIVVARGVRAVEKYFIKKGGAAEEDEDQKLKGSAESIIKGLEGLKGLPQESLLVFMEENGHLDGRTAFIKKLKEVGCNVEAFKTMWFDPAAGDLKNAVKFIQVEASRMGIRLDGKTAGRFAEIVGADRGNIIKELEKLSVYSDKGASPTIEDVESVVTESYEAGIFHLVDVIGMGKLSDALDVLSDLMDRGAVAPYILAMILRQIRLIARVREAIKNGISKDPSDLASALKESPFVLRKVLNQSRLFPDFKYPDVLEWLMETDLHLKRSTMPPKLALEMLIAKLTRRSVTTGFEPGADDIYHSRRGGRT